MKRAGNRSELNRKPLAHRQRHRAKKSSVIAEGGWMSMAHQGFEHAGLAAALASNHRDLGEVELEV